MIFSNCTPYDDDMGCAAYVFGCGTLGKAR